MPRPKNIIPSIHLTTSLPLDVLTKLNAHLYSELEGCIPRGAYQTFFVERINEFFNNEHIDLATYLPAAEPGSLILYGSSAAVTTLKGILK